MSKGPVKVSAEEAAKNQAFLASMAASGKERYIKRHSLQARLTHGITIAACILLCISGPVSYTHLDVYKRQDHGTLRIKRVASSETDDVASDGAC